jgi:hypothetical protein
MDLETVRRELAQAEADLKVANDYLASVRLRAEMSLVEAVDGDTKQLGSNEADRKRAFDARIEMDEDCRHALSNVRALEATIFKLKAERDIHLDRRAERQLAIQERSLDHDLLIAGMPERDLVEPR